MIVAEAEGLAREITATVTAGGRLVDLRISPYAMEQDPRRLADEILRTIDRATTQADAAARRALEQDVPGADGDAPGPGGLNPPVTP